MRRENLSVLELEARSQTGSPSFEETVSGGEFAEGTRAKLYIGLMLSPQPWTASSATREQTDAEKVKKLQVSRVARSLPLHEAHLVPTQYLITVRNDLEEVRRLVKFSHEREEQKLLQAQALQEFIDEVLFPHDSKLRFAFEKIGRYVLEIRTAQYLHAYRYSCSTPAWIDSNTLLTLSRSRMSQTIWI